MKILIATGASGGHIFPAINVADELKHLGHEVTFAGVLGNYKKSVSDKSYQSYEIHAQGLKYGSWISFLTSPFFMIWAFLESLKISSQVKPNVVIGFGGYGAFPICLAARMTGRPVLIHEQNVVPGRANALLASAVQKIALSFKKSEQFIKSNKTFVTGCPSRKMEETPDKQQIYQHFRLKENTFTILVLGGSQGSRRINQEFLNCIENLKKDIRFQVIHASGKQDFSECESQYKKNNIPYYCTDFLENIESAYQIADCVITRAGAATVTELIAYCLPAIVIPYPHAGGHQVYNAKILEDAKAGMIISENDLIDKKLRDAIVTISQDNEMKNNIMTLHQQIYNPQAAYDISREAILLGEK